MFRSFLLRISLILSSTACVSLMLMAATLGLQGLGQAAIFCLILFLILLAWLLLNLWVQRKVDPELSVEVARMLYPAGAVLSILLSALLAIQLGAMIPGDEGKQHFIIYFVGIGVALFLMVRCFDIKWLRGEDEILSLEERGGRRGR